MKQKPSKDNRAAPRSNNSEKQEIEKAESNF